MKIFILHGKGVPYSLDRHKLKHGETLIVRDVSPSTSIQELKQIIIDSNPTYKTWFTEKSPLMYAGEVLDRPLRTLKEYKIGPDAQLTFAHWYTFNVSISSYKMKLFRKAFDNYDEDGSGEIDSHELHTLVNELGMYRTKQQCAEMVANIDVDDSGEIDFEEFCQLMVKIMQEDSGAAVAAMEDLRKFKKSNDELRQRDSGCLIMWDPGYPGKNGNRIDPEERYGQVVFVKDEHEKKGRYIFQSDHDEYLKSLPKSSKSESCPKDYGVVFQPETNSYVFKSDFIGSSSP
jgi:hypothetical protein